MKKVIIVLVVLLTSSISAFSAKVGEAVMSGKILDASSNAPVAYATVALMKSDSTFVAGGSSNDKGDYELKAQEGNYIFVVSLIGYVDYKTNVSLKAGQNKMEPVLLEEDAQTLNAATVTGRQPLVEMKIDKLVMNVSQSPFAQSSNALELLKKAPGVTVDKDGNVKLNGKDVTIWMDGRPSYADGKTLESLLRSTNGESIDKFELMEHPSSKYDAAGQGGIINIKTKRTLLQGFNGSMGAGGGGMYFKDMNLWPWQESFWANISYRGKKTNTFVNMFEGVYNTPVKVVNDFVMPSEKLHQIATSDLYSSYFFYNMKIGNDWFINDKNTIGVIAYIPGQRETFNSLNSHTDQYIDDVLKTKTTSVIKNGPNKNLRHNLNLNYTHIFNPATSSELTVNADYYHNTSDQENTQNDETTTGSLPPVIIDKLIDSHSIYDIYSAKLDYQGVLWKKFMFETGAKWSLSNTDNNSLETTTLQPDIENLFVYREQIGAVYASLAGQIGPKWSFKAGLRGEYTYSHGDWKTSSEVTTHDYFDLFPTAYLGFTPSEKWRLSLTYNRRVRRPSYFQLNPTKTYVDAKTYTQGNPKAMPQYSNDVSFMVGYSNHYSLSLAYNRTNNMLNQLPAYTPDGTQYLTWTNVGTQDLAYASFNISSLPVAKWLELSVGIVGMYTNSYSAISGLRRGCWMGQGNADITFLLPKNWKIGIDAYGSTPMIWGSFRIHSMFMSDLAIKKTLLDNRLTLAIKLEDIFRTSSNNLDVLDEYNTGATTSLKQIYDNQILLFDISWNFGKAQKPMRARKVGSFDEMSRVEGGGAGGGIGK